ncbi:hypothetical protein AMAG_16457 [Allomyces macrogynus ATCC 38327]|uniref:SAC3/GANP/THP3 conserved domain-containing protein n=1 Tax=Allomyces macrogynus (strain ATCC 38327) TaxID=578462 RepID=A0A0L0TDP0_ALLM3|nr:hypothetical protein AMAG_16457 [Allomyces macrogynus ATCC 38327]|eukprot:KNE72699.1 hypothetical protein AMAG_16457 [Allomyces macrogynus ATCC 38327]
MLDSGFDSAHFQLWGRPVAHPLLNRPPLPLKAARTRYEAEEAEVKRSLNDAYMQGMCMAKCSRFEYLERVLQNTCDPWELGADGKPDYNLFVKSFTRSSAGTVQHPDDLRPPEALKLSHEYLLSLIETHSFHATYKFVYDRFRAICRDRTTQHLHLPELATIYEQIIRFYLLAVFLEPEGLVRALELKDLSGVLSDLIYMYSLGVASEHEAEFQCYQVLLYFTDRAKRDALLLKYAESTDPYVRATKQLCLHMAAPSERGPGTPISTYDYARMIKMLKNDLVPLGIALVVTLHLDRLRRDALKDMMLSGFHPNGRAVQTRIDLVTLTRILQFKDANECREFLNVFAIPVQEGEDDGSEAAIELSRAYAPLLDVAIDIKEPVATKKHPSFLDARVDLGKGFDVVQFFRTGEERTRQVLVAPPQGHGIGTAAAAAAAAAAATPAGGAAPTGTTATPGSAFVPPPAVSVAPPASATLAPSASGPAAPAAASPFAVPNLFAQSAATAPATVAAPPFVVPAPFGQPAPPPPSTAVSVPSPAAAMPVPPSAFTGFSLALAPTATTAAPTASSFAVPPPPAATSPPRSPFAIPAANASPVTNGFQVSAPATSAPSFMTAAATTEPTPATTTTSFAVPASPPTNGVTASVSPAPAPPSTFSFVLPAAPLAATAASQPASLNGFAGPLFGTSASAVPPLTAPAPVPLPTPPAPTPSPAATSKLADSSTQTDLPPIRIAAPTLDDHFRLGNCWLPTKNPEVFPNHRGSAIPDRSNHWSKRAKRSNDAHAAAPSAVDDPAVAAWTRRRIQRAVLRHWKRAARAARLDRAPRLSATDLAAIFSDANARAGLARGAQYRVAAPDLVAAVIRAVADPAWTDLARAVVRLQAVQRDVYSPWIVLAAANHIVQAFRDLVALVATAWNALGAHIEAVQSRKPGLPREWTTAHVPDLVPTEQSLPPAAARVLCIQYLKSAARGAIEASNVPDRDALARAVTALPGYNLTVPFGYALLPWLRAVWEGNVTAHPVVVAAREVGDVLVPGRVLVEVGKGVEQRAVAFLGWMYSSMEVVLGKVREEPVVE